MKGTLLKSNWLLAIKLTQIPFVMGLLKAACRQTPSPKAASHRCAAERWHPSKTKSPPVTAGFAGATAADLAPLALSVFMGETTPTPWSDAPSLVLSHSSPLREAALLWLLSLMCCCPGTILVSCLRTASLPNAWLSFRRGSHPPRQLLS